MSDIRFVTLLRCFLRTYLSAAALNTRGMQNIGFVYAMEPGLVELYAAQAQLQEARGRYLRHHNCHPFWNPMLAGVFLRTEADIAAGKLPARAFIAFKDATNNALSAVGDSVFGGSLLVTWALAACNLIVAEQEAAAVMLGVTLFIALQIFKAATFIAGVRYGFAALLQLRHWDIINWGDTLKLCNALLLAGFLFQVANPAHAPLRWIITVTGLGCAAWLVARICVARVFLAYAGLLAAIGIYYLITNV